MAGGPVSAKPPIAEDDRLELRAREVIAAAKGWWRAEQAFRLAEFNKRVVQFTSRESASERLGRAVMALARLEAAAETR